MKLRNLVQAVLPTWWLIAATAMILFEDGLAGLALALPATAWLASALALHPKRKWTWWACLTPLALCVLLGLACFATLIHIAVFEEHWRDANQPGAIALISGFFFIVPSALLIWHLLALRSSFSTSPTNS